jgi:hypothetical protein
MPGQETRWSPLTSAERVARVQKFEALQQRIYELAKEWLEGRDDAFAQLVGYPVHAAAEANRRFFGDELGDLHKVAAADNLIALHTQAFGERIAGGKWNGFIRSEPADNDWRSMRIEKWKARGLAPVGSEIKTETIDGTVSLEAEHFKAKSDRGGAGWAVIPGLGRTGDGSVAVFPTTMAAVQLQRAKADAPRLDYNIHFFKDGEFLLRVNLIPTHPLAGGALCFAVALDEGEPQLVELAFKDGSAEWAQGVLDNTRVVTTTLSVPTAGVHTLRIYGLEAGVVIDKLVLSSGALPPGYLGPPETRVDNK